ncbi:Rha family transcriptional regulator [Chitiniphilus shinanonensis]|uniref:Rha family transcriptional regulator n=1 Tax=Chitiniphilus shinanonensis TaxID=553088 RepID=UPI00303E8E09
MIEMNLPSLNDLVMIASERILTDSRRVAKAFGKQHKDVLRRITKLGCSRRFAERNFTLCHENNELQNGKPQPFYQITKDGFVLLVMGFTGQAAMAIKEAYIEAFNAMAEYIQRRASSAWEEYRLVAVEFAKCRETASLCGKGLRRWRQIKPQLTRQLSLLENEMQPSLLT